MDRKNINYRGMSVNQIQNILTGMKYFAESEEELIALGIAIDAVAVAAPFESAIEYSREYFRSFYGDYYDAPPWDDGEDEPF